MVATKLAAIHGSRGPFWVRIRWPAGAKVVAHGPLAQLVAHLHDAQGVGGSSPSRPTGKGADQALAS